MEYVNGEGRVFGLLSAEDREACMKGSSWKARAEKAEAEREELKAENERLQSFDHIRSIMVFYVNREGDGDENTQLDDIVREWKAQKEGS